MHNYKELNIWKRSMKLAVEVHRIVASFLSSECYELTSRIKRVVSSIPLNIAEGAGRNSNGEFIHFIGIANDSSSELSTQLLIASELQLIAQTKIETVLKELDEIQKMMYGVMENLKTKQK